MDNNIIDAIKNKKRICMYNKEQVKIVYTCLYKSNIRFSGRNLEDAIKLGIRNIQKGYGISTVILENGWLKHGNGHLNPNEEWCKRLISKGYKDVRLNSLLKNVINK